MSRIKVCNTLVLRINLYGSVIWTRIKNTKNDRHHSRWKFSEEQTSTTFSTTQEIKKSGGDGSRTSWRKTQNIEPHLLRHVTRMNNKKMPEIMLNFGPNGRRRLGRTLKRLWRGRNRSIKDKLVMDDDDDDIFNARILSVWPKLVADIEGPNKICCGWEKHVCQFLSPYINGFIPLQ